MNRTLALLSIFVSSACGVLSACGGGNSGAGAGSAAPVAFNLGAAVANLSSAGLSANLTISGTVNGVTVSGTAALTDDPAVADTFNGVVGRAQTTQVSGTIIVNGQSSPYSATTVSYEDPNYATLGMSSSAEYDVAQSPLSLPSSVSIGGSASLGTLSRYSDSTKSVSLGTIDASYSAKADPANSGAVIFSIVHQTYDTAHTLTVTDQTNYVVTAAGAISFQSASVKENQSGGADITFTAQ